MLVDAHVHLDKYDDAERNAVLAEIDARPILTLAVSVDVPSFLATEAIAARSPWVIPAFGLHPWDARGALEALPDVAELTARSPFIGEIGLDYRFVTDRALFLPQREVFARLLDVACGQGKLVNVHCPGAERDTVDMMVSHRVERAIVHWYSGPLDILGDYIAAGYHVTVGVEVLRSDHIREVARTIPDGQLLLETDNPGGWRWLTEEPGLPGILDDVVAEVARVRETTPAAVATLIAANTRRLFTDDPHLAPWAELLDSTAG